MERDRAPYAPKTGWKEIAWFVALWAGGVAAITAVGGLIKLIL